MLQFVLTINVEGLTYSQLAAALRQVALHVPAGRYDMPVVEPGDAGRIQSDDDGSRVGSWHIEDTTVRYGGR